MLDLFPTQRSGAAISSSSAGYAMIMHYGFSPRERSYQPYWLVVDMSIVTPKQTKIILKQGQQLVFQYSAQRYCTGRYDLSGHTIPRAPCPEKALLPAAKSSLQCPACVKATGFHPAFDLFSIAELSPQQQQYNRLPHDVYLAFFAPGVIKVGISSHRRQQKRWLEQGARAACLLQAMPDAYQARALEKKVVALGLLERVYAHQKKQWLLHCPFNKDRAKLQLTQKRAAICKSLDLNVPSSPILDFENIYWPTKPPSLAPMNAMGSLCAHPWAFYTMVGDMVVLYHKQKYALFPLKAELGRLNVAL